MKDLLEMDWLEEKIDIVAKSKGITRNEIWGENSDWATIGLSAGFENELLDRIEYTLKNSNVEFEIKFGGYSFDTILNLIIKILFY